MTAGGRFWRWRNPVVWGIYATEVIFIFGAWLSNRTRCDTSFGCSDLFTLFLAGSPNEIGDTLAGFGSLLAFVWLIIAVSLQQIELLAQRNDWKKTSSTLDVQVLILKEERLDRQRARADNEASAIISRLVELGSSGASWEQAKDADGMIAAVRLFAEYPPGDRDERTRFLRLLQRLLDADELILTKVETFVTRPYRRRAEEVYSLLRRLHKLRTELSPALLALLPESDVFDATQKLEGLLLKRSLWSADISERRSS